MKTQDNKEIERHITSLGKKLALDRRETATALGISTATVDRLRDRGLIKPSLATRKPLYPVFEIERFLKDTSENLLVEEMRGKLHE
jgi:hypothetical protein